MLKKISTVFILYCILFLQACEASEISLVKNAIMNLDNSLTWGKAFDTYQFFEEPTWEVLETDRGQQIVSFIAKYKAEGIIAAIKKQRRLPSEVEKDMIAYLNESLPIYATAEFHISSDKKSFQMAYLGFYINGNSPTRRTEYIELDLVNVIKNEPLVVPTIYDNFEIFFEVVHDALARALLNNIPYNDYIFASSFKISKSNKNFQLYNNSSYLSNIVLFKISDIYTANSYEESYIDIDFIVTDKRTEYSQSHFTAEELNKITSDYQKLYEFSIRFYPTIKGQVGGKFENSISLGMLELLFENENGEKGSFQIFYDDTVKLAPIYYMYPPQELQVLIDKEYGTK